MWFRGEIKNAHQYLIKALKIGEEIEDRQVIGYAYAYLAWTCMTLGLLDESIACGEKALEISESLESDHYIYDRAQVGMGWAYYFKGEVKKVLAAGEALLEYGQSHDSIRCLAMGHLFLGVGHLLAGDRPLAVECIKKAVEVSADPAYTQASRTVLGMVYTMNSQIQEAKDVMQQVITFGEKFGVGFFVTMSKMLLGAVSMAEGRMEQGLKMIEEAQRTYLEDGDRSMYALSEYMLGNIYLQMVEKAAPVKLTTVVKNIGFLAKNLPFAARKAENHYNKAIEISREIGAKYFMGMAYLDLGTLHRAKGEKTRARECLSIAIELFEQCEMEMYLKQAREALDSVR